MKDMTGARAPVFASEYPSPIKAVVPEYFNALTLEGMLSGTALYPKAHHVMTFDPETRELFVRTKEEISFKAKEPESMQGRAGIMRIYDYIDGETIDGFVADMRYLQPGAMYSIDGLSSDVADSDSDNPDSYIEEQGIRQLIAVVFNDPDGNVHYVGDRSVETEVMQLMNLVDGIAAQGIATETASTETRQQP